MARRFRYLDVLEGIEERPHLEQVAILQQLLRQKPTKAPPIEFLALSLDVGMTNRKDVMGQIRECLDTQRVRYDIREYRRWLRSHLKFRIYLDDWRDLMVYLALEQSLRKFVEAAA